MTLDPAGTTAPRLIAFLLGAALGSFLNVCVARWPKELSVVSPRSRCPGCGHEITWYENVPLVSWLALRARCSGCGERISAVYPLVELVVALGWLAAVVQYGPSLTALRVAVFGTVLLGVMLTDAANYLIPDGFTLFGLLWALLFAGVAAAMGETSPFAGLYDAVAGALIAASLVYAMGWLGKRVLHEEAMGFGDVTLMAMVGAHVGVWRGLLTIFVGAALGLVVFVPLVFPLPWLRSRRAGTEFEKPKIPFGVFLAPAAMIMLLWGHSLIAWYFGMMGP
ncbi:MAG: prepilin peptidase [Gemmatimonadaceae bacterium]